MIALINAQEAVARQGIPEYATPLDYLKEDERAHTIGDHFRSSCSTVFKDEEFNIDQ